MLLSGKFVVFPLIYEQDCSCMKEILRCLQKIHLHFLVLSRLKKAKIKGNVMDHGANNLRTICSRDFLGIAG